MNLLVKIFVMLGSSASTWIEQRIERSRIGGLEDNRALQALTRMRTLAEEDDARLAAIQKKRSSELVLPDKTRIGILGVLTDGTKAKNLLTEYCQEVARGHKEYRTICRQLDILAFGAEIAQRGYRIMKALCK